MGKKCGEGINNVELLALIQAILYGFKAVDVFLISRLAKVFGKSVHEAMASIFLLNSDIVFAAKGIIKCVYIKGRFSVREDDFNFLRMILLNVMPDLCAIKTQYFDIGKTGENARCR